MAMIDLEGFDSPEPRRRPAGTSPTGYAVPRGTSPNTTYPGTQPGADRTFGAFEVPGRQPSAEPDLAPFSVPPYRPSNGNTGFAGGMDPSNWANLFGGGQQASAAQPFNYGNFRQAAEQIGGQYSGSLQDFVNNVFPQLQAQFPGIERFGSKGDKIKLPNGQTIDAVISAGLGGTGYQWGVDSGGGGYFDDPMLQQYLDFATGAMNRLSSPQGMNPVLQDAIAKLNSVFGARDPGFEQFGTIANRRLTQLRNPLFAVPEGSPGSTPGAAAPVPKYLGTDTPIPQPDATWVPNADGSAWVPPDHPMAFQGSATTGPSANTPDAMRNSALLRTKFVEPLEQQRSAAQDRAVSRAATRGIGLGSGVLEDEARQIDNSFDQQITQGYRDLMLQEIAANEAREQEAVGIGQMLAAASGRNTGTQLSAAGQLAGIGQGLQGQEIQNLLNAVGLSQNMAMMPGQMMGQAIGAMNSLDNQRIPQMDAAPQQESIAGLISLLLGASGQGENVYNNTLGQESAFWGQLFQSLPGLLNAFPGLFGGSGAASGGLDPGLPHA